MRAARIGRDIVPAIAVSLEYKACRCSNQIKSDGNALENNVIQNSDLPVNLVIVTRACNKPGRGDPIITMTPVTIVSYTRDGTITLLNVDSNRKS